MMVDLLGVPRCTEQQLASQACPASSQVGDVAVDSPFALLIAGETPVFNIAPSSPNVAGALGFTFGGVGLIAHLSEAITLAATTASRRSCLDLPGLPTPMASR